MKFSFKMTMVLAVTSTVTMTMFSTMSNAFTLPTSTNSYTTTTTASSFSSTHNMIRHHPYGRRPNKLCMVVDPISVNVGIAVVSAAAGAATQFPKIQELERELDIAKLALTEVRRVTVRRIRRDTHLCCLVFVMVKSGSDMSCDLFDT